MSIEFRSPNAIPPARMLLNPVHFLSLGFGSGLSPWAPGTTGTLAAIPVYWLMLSLPIPLYIAVTLLFLVTGFYLCGQTSRALGVEDHRAIVWDEVVGYLITMTLMPPGLVWMVAGFVLFRFFDVLKPWPASWLDRHVKGGAGIMLDDVVAGLYAFGAMQGLLYAWSRYTTG